MKLNRYGMLAVALMVGSLGAIGCAPAGGSGDASASRAQAVDPAAPGGVAQEDARVTIPAPPAPKVEEQGAAPNASSVWSPGYWRYDTAATRYAWVGGYWQDRALAAPYAPPPLRVEYVTYAPAGNYFWAPGYWRWAPGGYVWMPGYWAMRRDGFGWVRPYWVSYGGTWECHGWGWERRTAGWGRDADDWSRHGWSRHDREDWDRRYRSNAAHRENTAVDRREHETRQHVVATRGTSRTTEPRSNAAPSHTAPARAASTPTSPVSTTPATTPSHAASTTPSHGPASRRHG